LKFLNSFKNSGVKKFNKKLDGSKFDKYLPFGKLYPELFKSDLENSEFSLRKS
jgi:hypothetical protein